MMQKLLLGIWLISITAMTSCGQNRPQAFPTQLQTTKTSQHVRVLGTKVFGVFPADYQFIKQLSRYQKNDDLYVQVVESHTSSFEQGKANLSRQAIEAKGATVDVWESVRVNGYEAIYLEGPSKHAGETKFMLAFGDNTFVVLVAAVAKTADKAGQDELRAILRSIYYDRAWQLDPLELANFTFDQTLTHFAYVSTTANLFLYAENGKVDPKNMLANTIQVMPLPKMSTDKDEEFIQSVLRGYERHGVAFATKTITRTTIQNYPALVVESKTTLQGKEGVLYQALIVGENSSLLFAGTAYQDPAEYADLFKKTAQTVKIK
jgi:hypothetical protein